MSPQEAPAPCPEVDPLWGLPCGEPAGHLADGRPHRTPGHGYTWEPLPGMPPAPTGTIV